MLPDRRPRPDLQHLDLDPADTLANSNTASKMPYLFASAEITRKPRWLKFRPWVSTCSNRDFCMHSSASAYLLPFASFGSPTLPPKEVTRLAGRWRRHCWFSMWIRSLLHSLPQERERQLVSSLRSFTPSCGSTTSSPESSR